LRDSDHSHIRYKKVAEADGKEVPKEHIVKGYEYEKDHYVVLSPEDFQQVQIKSNQTVDIREFVSLVDIEPQFFDQPYYLAPEKGGEKAYALLRTALEKTGLAGIAKVVLRPPREHLAVLKPLDGILMLETLHFADELRNPSELRPPEAAVGQKELEMAISLVKSMNDQWEPAKYQDEYRDSLMKVIEEKLQAGGKKLVAARPHPQTGEIIDLVTLLQESLGKTDKKKAKKPAARVPHRKAA
jgi:DNA end-binding protein Ku